jgi:ABC-type polysaccharide/polyol phosphate export permease
MPDQAPPDTLSYLILALAVVVIVVGGYLASMVVRYRSLQQDVKLVEQLRSEN